MLLSDECRDILVDAVDQAEHEARFPSKALAIVREAGLLSVHLDTDEPDHNPRDIRSLVESVYEAGRVSAALGTIVSMHLQQAHVIALHGTEKLKETLGPALASGDHYIGSVTTERSSGGALRESDSVITRRGDLMDLDRDAPIVTGGEVCDSFLVKVSEPDGRPSLVHVPREDAQVDIGRSSWDPMGMRESASMALRLRSTVPDWRVVGRAGEFDRIVSDSFGVFAHIGWAAAWLGTATECGNRLVRAIRESPRLRSKITDSDVMLARLSSAHSALDVVRRALEALVADYANGRSGNEFAIRTNDLKLIASTHCFDAVDTMVEIGGLPLGYMRNPQTRIERAFRDLRSASLNFSNDRLSANNGKLILRAGFGRGPFGESQRQ
ncbi:acyl-CoA dehydrogenase family protein [Nocardia salmonicida]|uniref:acyl-CoA dehydrogenase family protein n=1 Tax=Nocardia salmonicida TaxID=53431 RepID=UPI003653E832